MSKRLSNADRERIKQEVAIATERRNQERAAGNWEWHFGQSIGFTSPIKVHGQEEEKPDAKSARRRMTCNPVYQFTLFPAL